MNTSRFFKRNKSIWADEKLHNDMLMQQYGYYSVNMIKKDNPNIFNSLQQLNLLDRNIATLDSQQAQSGKESEQRRFYIKFIGDRTVNPNFILDRIKEDCHYLIVYRSDEITYRYRCSSGEEKINLTRYQKDDGTWDNCTNLWLNDPIEDSLHIFRIHKDIQFIMKVVSKDYLDDDSISNDILRRIIQSC